MPFIASNSYLSRPAMENNALFISSLTKGVWTVNALSAILGNMQTESTINPGIWENLEPYYRGYGLTQWSPYTKLTDWIIEQGWAANTEEALTDYGAQITRINYEAENGLQWFSNPEAPIPDPPITLSEFLQSDLPPSTLANYFLWYYEHPAVTIQPIRAQQANEWYEFLTGEIPPGPGPETERRKLPIWYYLRQL